MNDSELPSEKRYSEPPSELFRTLESSESFGRRVRADIRAKQKPKVIVQSIALGFLYLPSKIY